MNLCVCTESINESLNESLRNIYLICNDSTMNLYWTDLQQTSNLNLSSGGLCCVWLDWEFCSRSSELLFFFSLGVFELESCGKHVRSLKPCVLLTRRQPGTVISTGYLLMFLKHLKLSGQWNKSNQICPGIPTFQVGIPKWSGDFFVYIPDVDWKLRALVYLNGLASQGCWFSR